MLQIDKMAQQDKTDWYWNGVLAGAVNNLYYDFINVDVVHVPYVTTHRNSSFFLQTRMNYYPSNDWTTQTNAYKDWDVVDVKYIREDKCRKTEWMVYIMLANRGKNKIRIHKASIQNWCVWDINWSQWAEYNISWCAPLKLFTTNYVKWPALDPWDIKEDTWTGKKKSPCYGIQINKYEWWTIHWLFSDDNVENGSERFANYNIWQYILVYESLNRDWDWFAGQVRMITWKEWSRLTLATPWQWFTTPEWDVKEVAMWWVKYRIFDDWWEVLAFSEWNEIYIMPDKDSNMRQSVYSQYWNNAKIISVAEATEKIFILTDNWYIHYSHYVWLDKFFVNDDMFAWIDKTSITSYRDVIIAFWKRHIAVWVPDDSNTYTTMYNQSNIVWLRSRYSYGEYDWDLVFVSNDKRLLALWIAQNTWKYMLQYEDVWDMLNSKLSMLTPWDEIFIWNDWNNLRIFLQTKSQPYYSYANNYPRDYRANLTDGHENFDWEKVKESNTMTRIIKFDKQFKVWTEDWVQWILLQWIEWGVYYWENWLYLRSRWSWDFKWNKEQTSFEYKAYISAYLIENESDWVWGTGSWLANRAKLYNVAKLNRLITTLWPWVYTHWTKIRVTSYVKWLWNVYEFPVDWESNDWLWLITTKYIWEEFDEVDEKKLECMNSVIQDSQKKYQPKCTSVWNARVQDVAQQQPWCESYWELNVLDRWICINDSLYELAPTMPLVTSLWENQSYATQIKIELEWWIGDIITFGGRLWEMYIAPLFTIWPDWEYQLQPNTDC